jgi:hypothetical protein
MDRGLDVSDISRGGPPPLIRHLEGTLGPIQAGWTGDSESKHAGVQIVSFNDAPEPGATTLSTLGLSNHVLQQPKGPIRQELVFAYWARHGDTNIPSMLQYLAGSAIAQHRAFLRGEWDSFDGPIIDGTNMTALCVTSAVGFPEEFGLVEGMFEELLVFVRVIPLTKAEVRLREHEGAGALEAAFLDRRVDLLDLSRASAV